MCVCVPTFLSLTLHQRKKVEKVINSVSNETDIVPYDSV